MTATEILRRQHKSGTYIELHLSEASALRLTKWCDQQGISHQPISEFHCTICYSSTPVPQAEIMQGPATVTAKIIKWANLGDKATVLLIESPIIQKLFKLLKQQGAKHDYPQFTPHVTIDPDKHTDPLPTKIPQFELIFDQIRVDPLVD